MTNKQILTAKIVNLQNKLTKISSEVDTLNTEFGDRSAARTPSKWGAMGLNSKQDWIFLAFFASYALLCLVILTYTVLYMEQKMQAAFMVVLAQLVIGIMISGVIKYYA